MKVEIDFYVHNSPHTLAFEYEWEGTDGVTLLGNPAGPPLRLVVNVTQLDACEARA